MVGHDTVLTPPNECGVRVVDRQSRAIMSLLHGTLDTLLTPQAIQTPGDTQARLNSEPHLNNESQKLDVRRER